MLRVSVPDGRIGRARTAADIVRAFEARLPEVRRLLSLDVEAALRGDPAATHRDEIMLCYPGMEAVFAHRVAHELYLLGVPLVPRMLAEVAHSRTGIDIHPGAQIGRSFFIDHGSGVVIGETACLGAEVRLYQGVTLGAKSLGHADGKPSGFGPKRHPTIGDRVTIYAGAVILGGETEIGDDCVIGGGVFLTGSVPPGHVVRQRRPVLEMRKHTKPGARRAGGSRDA